MAGTETTKSDFIRSKPNMAAADVVAAAKAKGMKITPGHVWSVRSAERAKVAVARKRASRSNGHANGHGTKPLQKGGVVVWSSGISPPLEESKGSPDYAEARRVLGAVLADLEAKCAAVRGALALLP